MGLGIGFHAAEVVQIRNMHDLTKDFQDEIPGFTWNRHISDVLTELKLDAGTDAVCGNLLKCYMALVSKGIFPDEELNLVKA